MIRDSKPFSSSTEYEWFCEQYCERCRHYKEGDSGFPVMSEDGGCPIRDKVEYARFNESFPSECFADLFEPNGKAIAFNVCRHFFAENEDDQFKYFRMFMNAICGKEEEG